MNKQNDFDDPDNGFGFLGSVGPKAAFFIVLIALSFMIGLVWKLYTGGNDNNTEVPIIRADADGYKMEPDDPGGMEIKFQDSALFNSNDADSDVENLLADNNEEAPMPRSQLFAGLSTDDEMPDEMLSVEIEDGISEDEERIIEQAEEAEKIVEDLVENGADAIVVQNAEGQSDVVVVAATDDKTSQSNMTVEKTQAGATKIETPKVIVETKPETKPEAKLEPAVIPKADPKPAPKAEPKAEPIVAGDFYVQLASVKSNAAAKDEWDKFVLKYSPLLDGASHRIETADLGAKGTFYRIQAGSMSKLNADNICNGIKSKGGSCLVKKK